MQVATVASALADGAHTDRKRRSSRDAAWMQTWSRFYQRLLDRFLRETYGHSVSVQLLAAASTALLLSCTLYFFKPLLDDDYHLYQRYLPWLHLVDFSASNSFVVDHAVVLLAIALPMGWLLLVNVAYSRVATRLEVALLLLRVACCLTVCAALTVILAEFLSRRVMIALLALAYGALGLAYAWSVPLWRWYLDTAATNGFVAVLPASLQELLLRTSLLEWLTDTSLSKRVQPFLPFLLPLSRTEQNRLLEQLPVDQQRTLTRPGLLPLMPASLQRALLPPSSPSSAFQQQQLALVDSDASSDCSTSSSNEDQLVATALPKAVDAGFAFQRTNDSNALTTKSSDQVLADIVTQRVLDGCKQLVQMPSKKTLNRTASVSTALFVLQLYASRRSRQMVATALQFLATSALGSVAACALLLRVVQFVSARLPNHAVPMLRHARHLLLRNVSNRSTSNTTAQLASEPETRQAALLRRAATSASVALVVAVAVRKLRG